MQGRRAHKQPVHFLITLGAMVAMIWVVKSVTTCAGQEGTLAAAVFVAHPWSYGCYEWGTECAYEWGTAISGARNVLVQTGG